ncbi:NMT1/THI5 like domain protein [Methylocella silvestris BL2]|uniref:NMT1/THI5 like domain protein n=1 Tax=Methylocella silvestris (strain DSM 15510 / CIP 108128 / LMG 27833 / NCIMB 13906 / BL2) TaxID=395965 RepID=B8EJQ8_METSB|nr:ABC transporter substrate-binding protein [Methylocella silvestris]ACK49462.1 NMT1/THI5 like domain protein [Methylocella silvestris BL2]
MRLTGAVGDHAPTRRQAVAQISAFCALGFSPSRGAAAVPKITVALVRSAGSGPLFIAAAKGYFADEGLDAELRFVASDDDARAAVAAGEAAFGVSQLTASFFSYAVDQRLTLIASQFSDQAGFPANALVIVKPAYDAGFKSVPDLRRKQIGLEDVGSGRRYALAHIAARYGLDPDELTIAALERPQREFEALRKGEIDAAVVSFHTALETASSASDLVLVRMGDLAQSQMGAVFTAQQTIDSNRPIVEKFIRAYQRGVASYDLTFLQRSDGDDEAKPDDYDSTLQLVSEQANVAPRLIDQAPLYCDRLGRLDEADVSAQLAFWQDHGMVARSASAANLIDGSFTAERLPGNPDPN